ncbi:MAG: hypothetical protein L6R42_009296, partial [Xanthoria sp. 1 TBL-2021]
MNFPEKRDSDSGHSPSDDEKKVGASPGQFQALGHADLPLDPDAGLSQEEKARI